MVEETAETDDGTVEDPPQGPQTVIASEDSSQPLLATDTTLDAVHTPGAAEPLAPAIEAPTQDMAETFPQQALGKMLAYSDSANVMMTASRRCSPAASLDSSVGNASGFASPMSWASLLTLVCPMQARLVPMRQSARWKPTTLTSSPSGSWC